MRSTFIATALTSLLLAISAVNAAPVADAEADVGYEVQIIVERDLAVHHLDKRAIVTITKTVQAQNFHPGRTRTITRTIMRTKPATTPDNTPAPAPIPATTPEVQAQAVQDTPAQSTPTTSSSSSSSDSSSSGLDANAQAALDSHNKYRALHGASALTWDDDLASYAASHASSCVFQHTGGPYGENLAAGYGSVSASIDAWYNEIKDYNFANGGFSVIDFRWHG